MPYFRCYDRAARRTFVIEVNDQIRIKQAQAIADGTETAQIHVKGIIVKESKSLQQTMVVAFRSIIDTVFRKLRRGV
jgi:hypothetical protein